MVDKRRLLLIAVIASGILLVVYGTLRATTGLRLPGRLDGDLPNAVIVVALAAFLYDRKLRAAEAVLRKAAEDEAKKAKATEDLD